MDTLEHPQEALIAVAASMRAAGQPWDAIGAAVDRHAETVRRWPDRYPGQWSPTFRMVESQLIAEAAIEARATLRLLLRAKRGKYRLAAASHLLTSNDRSRTLESQTAVEQVTPECARCRELATMSDDRLEHFVNSYYRSLNNESYDDGAGI